ncbi:MAG TPA: SUMF1/EgtB/PvdO family nonheme iron enzyme [Burkholderiales bacterium]|jgi:formylglycine-generating enzyme required for sulfatase activity|nr:SUMF1/EgtB/PvdO family nonheme iron enzyme [Burkholderiales bacterium]
MKIFLSYASEDREQAKSIYLPLHEQGHRVFFDRSDLPAGEEYHNRIRKAIEASDLFVMLVSPYAIDNGSYTLTELDIAERAGARLLPVMLRKPDVESLPAAIKAVTFLETDGSLPGAVAAEVHRISRELSRRRRRYAIAALAVVAAVSIAAFYATKSRLWNAETGKDGAPTVLIPAGLFIMGDDRVSPRRRIYVDAFRMDKYEVTVGRYAKFLQSTGNMRPPEEWDTVDVKLQAELPVVGVDWQDAASYCLWAGKRLPTEAEWEKAARGGDERRYPWGNDAPTADHATFGKPYRNPVYKDGVARVGAHPKGASPFGIHDLSGNAGEWVADWYADSFPRSDVRNPKGPERGEGKVVRGGGWYDGPDRITATRRMHSNLQNRADDVGFRCASD